MTGEQRANKLKEFVSEYLVRGKFFRSAEDEEGMVTSFWVKYTTLLEDLEDPEEDIEIFEGNAAMYREAQREEWEKDALEEEEGG